MKVPDNRSIEPFRTLKHVKHIHVFSLQLKFNLLHPDEVKPELKTFAEWVVVFAACETNLTILHFNDKLKNN